MSTPEHDAETLPAPRPHVGLPMLAEKKELLKRTVCKGATDDELEMFMYVAQRTGLDPFLRQIHAVKRWDSDLKRDVMAIQVGIDGLRLQGERTGRYAPGDDTVFTYNDKSELLTAKAFVKKQTQDGTWHQYSHTAHFEEYAQYKRDGGLTHMWKTKGHVMLGKCAEAGALRKGFPAETAGLYIPEEMPEEGADGERGAGPIATPRRKSDPAPEPPPADDTPRERVITDRERNLLFGRAKTAFGKDTYEERVRDYIAKEFGLEKESELTVAQLDATLKWVNAGGQAA